MRFAVTGGTGLTGSQVVTDPAAGMFAVVKGGVLTDKGAHLAPTRYTDWLS